MRVLIPDPWRRRVATLLDQASPGTVFVRQRPRHDWQNLDHAHYDEGLRAVLSEALNVRTPVFGKRHFMAEEGECYSFTFPYHPPSARGVVTLYAKLNLLPGGRVVVVYSVHP